MRKLFINSLIEKARKDDRIYLIVADLGFSVIEDFAKEFPDRYLNVGIAEQNAIGVAAGMALSGKIAYFYGIIPFVTMRCFEQVRIDIAYMNTNVRLVGVGGGYSYGPAGPSHHAIEDIAIMRVLPNMMVCCPGDCVELKSIMEESYVHNGPMYIRLGKGGEGNIHPSETSIKIGEGIQLKDGKDLIIITTGTMLGQGIQLVNELNDKDIHASLYSFHTLKPLDIRLLNRLIEKSIPIITLEEHNIIGGLGSAVAEVIAESGKSIPFKRIGIPDIYTHEIGSQNYLRKRVILNKDFFELIGININKFRDVPYEKG